MASSTKIKRRCANAFKQKILAFNPIPHALLKQSQRDRVRQGPWWRGEEAHIPQTYTNTHARQKSKENEMWRTMKKNKQKKTQMQILSLSSSLSLTERHPHMTRFCLPTKLRKINTNTNSRTRAGSVSSGCGVTHPHAPLLGHIRAGCRPLSIPLLPPLSLHTLPSSLDHLLWDGGLFIALDEHVWAGASAWGISVGGEVCFNCPSPCFDLSGCMSLAKKKKKKE